MFYRLIRTDNDPAALVMRLALGLVMFPHGAQKVLGWWGGYGAAATIQAFSKNGIPTVLAALVLTAEFAGSMGLIVGFLTRVAAFGVGCVMLGAILLVHLTRRPQARIGSSDLTYGRVGIGAAAIQFAYR